jgi:hypothetical protein
MSKLNKHFLKDLENYWHCEARDASSGSDLLHALSHPSHPISGQDFKSALAAAIERRTIDVKEYEEITGLDFEDTGEVVEDLRSLWTMMYGDESSLR